MPIKIDNNKFPAKKVVIFFVVETSGNMKGAKIGALNDTLEEVLPMVGEISKDNNDAEIEIAVLQFSSGAKWLYPNPVPAEGFSWRDLTAAGTTDFGVACTELASKLTRADGGFMYSASGSFAPVFILLSSLGPSDNYRAPLKNLKENKWFNVGIKIAIAIGDDDANLNVLEEFTGSKESVFTVHKIGALEKIIHCVAVTSSIVVASKQKQVEKQINTDLKEEIDKGTITPATGGNSIDDDWE
jgi:uncharacterized protein YegL